MVWEMKRHENKRGLGTVHRLMILPIDPKNSQKPVRLPENRIFKRQPCWCVWGGEQVGAKTDP